MRISTGKMASEALSLDDDSIRVVINKLVVRCVSESRQGGIHIHDVETIAELMRRMHSGNRSILHAIDIFMVNVRYNCQV